MGNATRGSCVKAKLALKSVLKTQSTEHQFNLLSEHETGPEDG